MKLKLLFLCLLSLVICGTVTASSINGDYKGNPIVKVYVNGSLVNSEVPAMIQDGSTLLPLRAVAESLGATVKWDQATYSAYITSDKNKPTQTAVNTDRPKLTATDIAKLMNRVGIIETYDKFNQPVAQGSGFLINENGLLITNYHVLNGSSKFKIQINNSTYEVTKYKFMNQSTDIFGVYIGNGHMPYLEYSNMIPQIGDKVYSIGSPGGLTNTISEGIVSGIRTINGMTMIQHTAFTDHGSSGGALLNEYGEVIGITSAGFEKTPLDFAIPMIYVQKEMDKLNIK